MNLGEALRKRTELQHVIAVYEELTYHLAQFLESDIGPSEAVLEVEDCLEKEVPSEVIDIVQQTLIRLKQDVESQLDSFSKLKVTNTETVRKKTKKK